MTDTELKPCPFCPVSTVILVYNDYIINYSSCQYSIGCSSCGCTTRRHSTRDGAIALWNTRAEEPRIKGFLENAKSQHQTNLTLINRLRRANQIIQMMVDFMDGKIKGCEVELVKNYLNEEESK